MRTQVLIVLFACLAFAHARDFSSIDYQSQTAKEKLDQLWDSITADTTPYGWYSQLALLELFFEDMKTSFSTYSDNMPAGRKKLIHSVGSVVKAEFVARGVSPYTGMFQGVSNALIRISLAKEPNPKGKPEGNFAPGMGIKLLRDSIPSANLVAMFSVEGQDSWNIFKYDWNHHIANPCSFALKLLAKKFAEATPFVGRMGLRTWARYDEKGRSVKDSDMRIPFKIIFRPSSDVANLFPDEYQKEFTQQLATIPAGSTLWDVYAVAEPHGPEVQIGFFRTTSNFTTSKFGDKDLFFQHNYIEDDLALHGNWTEYEKIDPPI